MKIDRETLNTKPPNSRPAHAIPRTQLLQSRAEDHKRSTCQRFVQRSSCGVHNALLVVGLLRALNDRRAMHTVTLSLAAFPTDFLPSNVKVHGNIAPNHNPTEDPWMKDVNILNVSADTESTEQCTDTFASRVQPGHQRSASLGCQVHQGVADL